MTFTEEEFKKVDALMEACAIDSRDHYLRLCALHGTWLFAQERDVAIGRHLEVFGELVEALAIQVAAGQVTKADVPRLTAQVAALVAAVSEAR